MGLRLTSMPRVQGRHTSGLEVLQIACHHGETMLEGGGGNQQISAIVTDGGR